MILQKTIAILGLVVIVAAAWSTQHDNAEKPDENRFTPVILAEGAVLDEPMAFEVLDDDRVFIIERKGGVKLYDPAGKTVQEIATIAVNTKYTSAEGRVREAEEGLVGLTVHPDFDQHPWVVPVVCTS